MSAENLLSLIRKERKYDDQSINEIKELIKKYPYFQTPRMMYLQYLSKTHSSSLPKELSASAPFITERKYLFLILNNEDNLWSSFLKKESLFNDSNDNTDIDSFALIDMFLARFENNSSFINQDLKFNNNSITDYTSNLLDLPDIDEENILNDQDVAIDNFINNSLDITQKLNNEILNNKDNDEINPHNSLDFSDNIISEDDVIIKEDTFLTESLAKIYIKQKKYKKALEIIKKLSLKYPEKNVYFADQIRFLEKIITNIKTE